MAPTKNDHARVIGHPIDIYKAMLDLLPVSQWCDLYQEVAKKHYFAHQFRMCKDFERVDE